MEALAPLRARHRRGGKRDESHGPLAHSACGHCQSPQAIAPGCSGHRDVYLGEARHEMVVGCGLNVADDERLRDLDERRPIDVVLDTYGNVYVFRHGHGIADPPKAIGALSPTRALATVPCEKALRRDDHHERGVGFTACRVFVDDLDQPAVSGRAGHSVTAVSQLPVAAPVADRPFDLVGGEAQQTTRDVCPAGYFDEELRHGLATIPAPCVLSQLAFSTRSGATVPSQAHDIAAPVKPHRSTRQGSSGNSRICTTNSGTASTRHK